MYAPNFCFLLAFWLLVRLVPKNTWSTEKLRFGALLSIFLMMYFVSIVLNGAGMLFTRNNPGGGEEQLDLIGSIVNTGTMVVMIISGLVLLIRHLKKKNIHLDNSMPTCIPKEDVVKTVYLNPGVILFFLLSVFTILSGMFNIRIPFLERLNTETGE